MTRSNDSETNNRFKAIIDSYFATSLLKLIQFLGVPLILMALVGFFAKFDTFSDDLSHIKVQNRVVNYRLCEIEKELGLRNLECDITTIQPNLSFTGNRAYLNQGGV